MVQKSMVTVDRLHQYSSAITQLETENKGLQTTMDDNNEKLARSEGIREGLKS